MKVLGIGASPRKGGNSDILLKRILKGAAGAGAETEEVHLRDYQYQSCIACEKCRKDEECTGLMDGMQLIYPKVREAAALVIVTPIHSYNMTAMLKAFIDRLYCLYHFGKERPGYWTSRLAGQGKKAVIAVIGEQSSADEGGMDLTMETIRRSVVSLGYDLVGELPVLGVFSNGKIKEKVEMLERAEALGKKLAG